MASWLAYYKQLAGWQKVTGIFLVIFLLWSRFWALGTIPATLTHDEIVYAIQAKSLVLQGTTLDQVQGFFSLEPHHPMYAEWPARIMALGFLLSDQPLVATHLVSALMGVALPFIVGCLVWSLWKNRSVAVAAGSIVVFNPLLWQMSRLSYDAFYSLWFYLAAGALFVRPGWRNVLLSLPLFLIGFFQYQGFKLLLVPWVLFLLVMMVIPQWQKHSRKHWRRTVQALKYPALAVIVACCLTLFYATALLPKQSVESRLDSIIFFDNDTLSTIVNSERRLSLAGPFAALVSNKATAIITFVLHRVAGLFDPALLLLNSEPGKSGFSVWTHGVFYWLEWGLVIAGLTKLLHDRARRWQGIAWLAGVFILALPALINSGSEWYLLRGLLSYTLILILAAWGLSAVWRLGKAWRIALIALYAVSIANFGYHYWYRYPVISLDWGNFDERLIARYIDLHQQHFPEIPLTVLSDEAYYVWWSYLVYSDAVTAESAEAVAQVSREYLPFVSERKDTYTLGNLTFTSQCAPREAELEHATLSQPAVWLIRTQHWNCGPDDDKGHLTATTESSTNTGDLNTTPRLSFLAVLDSGERFHIFGNHLCSGETAPFVHVQNLRDLNIETQGRDEFCAHWVKNLQNPLENFR